MVSRHVHLLLCLVLLLQSGQGVKKKVKLNGKKIRFNVPYQVKYVHHSLYTDGHAGATKEPQVYEEEDYPSYDSMGSYTRLKHYPAYHPPVRECKCAEHKGSDFPIGKPYGDYGRYTGYASNYAHQPMEFGNYGGVSPSPYGNPYMGANFGSSYPGYPPAYAPSYGHQPFGSQKGFNGGSAPQSSHGEMLPGVGPILSSSGAFLATREYGHQSNSRGTKGFGAYGGGVAPPATSGMNTYASGYGHKLSSVGAPLRSHPSKPPVAGSTGTKSYLKPYGGSPGYRSNQHPPSVPNSLHGYSGSFGGISHQNPSSTVYSGRFQRGASAKGSGQHPDARGVNGMRLVQNNVGHIDGRYASRFPGVNSQRHSPKPKAILVPKPVAHPKPQTHPRPPSRQPPGRIVQQSSGTDVRYPHPTNVGQKKYRSPNTHRTRAPPSGHLQNPPIPKTVPAIKRVPRKSTTRPMRGS